MSAIALSGIPGTVALVRAVQEHAPAARMDATADSLEVFMDGRRLWFRRESRTAPWHWAIASHPPSHVDGSGELSWIEEARDLVRRAVGS